MKLSYKNSPSHPCAAGTILPGALSGRAYTHVSIHQPIDMASRASEKNCRSQQRKPIDSPAAMPDHHSDMTGRAISSSPWRRNDRLLAAPPAWEVRLCEAYKYTA
jgi:hypothetical protein